jgi:radical SAM-linked protein
MTRLRVRFAKLGKVRWTSHRDIARMWERAFRRTGMPLAWTAGFSPRPKVSFGLALPTGYESVAEYLDLELTATGLADGTRIDSDALTARLSDALPAGVDVLATAVIDDRAPSLQEQVTSSTWRFAVVPLPGTPALGEADLADRVDRLVTADSVVVTRRRKGAEVTDDIRPGIIALRVIPCGDPEPWLECELTSRPRSLRPSELVAALGPGLEEWHVRREHQWIERDGARQEPLGLPADASTASHALERAS